MAINRSRHVSRCWLVGLLHLALPYCALGQNAVVQGRVIDNSGDSVASAHLSLQCAADTRKTRETSTASDGTYRFASVSACDYLLRVHADGFASADGLRIVVADMTTGTFLQDMTLSRVPASLTPVRPTFQAAGIKGLIDPGGYSASASAAAATDVLNDVSGVQRKSLAEPGSGNIGLDCTELRRLQQNAREHPRDSAAVAKAGRYLLHHGDPAAAIPYLADAVKLGSAKASNRLDLAEAQIRAGRFDEAWAVLASQEVPSTDRSREYDLKARAAEGMGRFDEAVQQYTLMQEAAPTEDGVFALAYENLLAGHTANAQGILLDGLKRFPASLKLHVGLGAVYFFQRHYEQAIRQLLQASDLDPLDARPYLLLADVSGVFDQLDASVQSAMERHVAVAPADAAGYAALGIFLMRCKQTASGPSQVAVTACDTGRAKLLLQKAVQLAPGLIAARAALATVYQREGKFALQVEQLEKLAKHSPEDRRVRYQLGLAYKRNGQVEYSEREMRAVQELSEKEPSNSARFAGLLATGATDGDMQPSTTPCVAGNQAGS